MPIDELQAETAADSSNADAQLTDATLEQNAMLADVVGGHSEGSICNIINAKYNGNCKYKLANGFIFSWESDFFVQKDNGYSYEFEVKISRSDFFSDKKKVEKHLALEKGIYMEKKTEYKFNSETNKNERVEYFEERKRDFRPNKFFYVLPKGLVSVNEIPIYAGLMYVENQNIETVKEAPFLHKNKLTFESVLCNKFYHYWINAKIELRQLQNEIKRLKSQSGSNIC